MPSTSFASKAVASASTSRRSAGESGLRRRFVLGSVLERGAGALERARHRVQRRLEHLGHLGRPEPEHVPQDQHGPLARRQELERRNEGQEMASLVS